MGFRDAMREADERQASRRMANLVGDLTNDRWTGDRWEYRVITLPAHDVETALNAVGESGWELVSTSEGMIMAGGTGASSGQVRVTLKRRRMVEAA